MAMTMTEKILARASGKPEVNPGDNVWVNVDVLMTHDVCGPGTIGIFRREFGADAKVWDREKVVIIPDHYIFTNDDKCHRNVDILRQFVREDGLTSTGPGAHTDIIMASALAFLNALNKLEYRKRYTDRSRVTGP